MIIYFTKENQHYGQYRKFSDFVFLKFFLFIIILFILTATYAGVLARK